MTPEPADATLFISRAVGRGKTTFYEAYLKGGVPSLVPQCDTSNKRFSISAFFAVEDIRVDTQLLDEASSRLLHKVLLFLRKTRIECRAGLGAHSRGDKRCPIKLMIPTRSQRRIFPKSVNTPMT